MREIELKKIDVFTTRPFCGNPAGIITMADGLTVGDMQRIASVLNLAECSFVMMPDSPDSDFRVRFFTQSVELDLSSHSLIAACFGVLEEGRIPLQHGITSVNFDTSIGQVPLDIYFDTHFETADASTETEGVKLACRNGASGMLRRIMTHQKRDDIRQADIPVGELASILGVDVHEITGTGLPLEILTHGLKQLIIPMTHKETLLNLKPDLIKLNLLNKRYDIQTNDICVLDPVSADASVFSRTFSPAIGLWEDVGSGSGCGSICAYLVRHSVINPGSIIVEQGSDPDCLARVYIEVDKPDGDSIALRIGGLAVTSFLQTVNFDTDTVSVV